MNRIEDIKDKFNIMTHVVAGYPDMDTCKQLIFTMVEQGVDLIEIQIPFSDPLADGPTIMKANQTALDNGITVQDCLDLVSSIRDKIDIPLLFMSYANIPFSYGMEKFMSDCSDVGIDGLIIPDIPFDENLDYIAQTEKKNIYPIQVVSPDISEERLLAISNIAKGFVYTTLKVGITGAGTDISETGMKFAQRLKSVLNVPVLAGFGISSKEHVEALKDLSDGAVIGSHVLNLLKTGGINSVESFLADLSSVV